MREALYRFEELEIDIHEVPVLISGDISYAYVTERAQPSVGFPGATEIVEIGEAVFDVLGQDDWMGKDYYKGWTSGVDTPIHKQIVAALQTDILEAAKIDSQIP
jgi:hypothetical protein